MTEPPFRTIEISDSAYEHEGLRNVTVKSRALGRRADVSVWVPEAPQIRSLLILLHGVYGSHWAWAMRAGVHRTAQKMLDASEIGPMVIAMPSDGLIHDGSAYLPWPHGENTEQWIVDEVPEIARVAALALDKDASVTIAGLSMGGYGALRLGAKYAERFAGISAHSAITRISEMSQFAEEPVSDYLTCAPNEELDALFWLRLHRDRLPRLRFDCGTEDQLLAGNRGLHAALNADKIEHEYSEFPGGHEWAYWQEHVQDTLRLASDVSKP